MQKKNFSWSIDLEGEEYINDIGRLFCDAKKAVEATEAGQFVNLVTPPQHGEPGFLIEELKGIFGEKIEAKFIAQCGCGGYVTRVWVKA